MPREWTGRLSQERSPLSGFRTPSSGRNQSKSRVTPCGTSVAHGAGGGSTRRNTMLRSISLATVLALATLTGLACIDDSATEEDLAQDLDDVDGKDDGLGPRQPYGTFVAEPAGAGEPLKLAP